MLVLRVGARWEGGRGEGGRLMFTCGAVIMSQGKPVIIVCRDLWRSVVRGVFCSRVCLSLSGRPRRDGAGRGEGEGKRGGERRKWKGRGEEER